MRGGVFWWIVVLSVSAGCLVEAFWDSIPVASQGKMVFLYMIGDSKEAKQTWDHFKNVSHLWEEVKDLDNSIPGYGQVKAIIVALEGDVENALKIAIDANKATFIVGGLSLGATGAVVGAIAADVTTSLIIKKPVGVVEHAVHIHKKTASEHVDAVLDLTLLATPTMGAKGKVTMGTKTSHNLHFKMKKRQSTSPGASKSSSGSSASSKNAQPRIKI